MIRNILMFVPALAFALPFIAAQPSMARPLATPVEASLWGGDDDDDDDGGDSVIQLQVCFETQIQVDLGDDRAYECGIQTGESCRAQCTAAAVSPLCSNELGLAARSASCVEEQIATCERQCRGDGAAFCSPLQARDGDDDDDDHDFVKHDDDDDDNGGDEVVFINIETCIDLELDLDNL